jgi:hypothetical protein
MSALAEPAWTATADPPLQLRVLPSHFQSSLWRAMAGAIDATERRAAIFWRTVYINNPARVLAQTLRHVVCRRRFDRRTSTTLTYHLIK